MSTVLRFSPDLGAWISHNLNQGCTPAAVIQAMREQQMAEHVAQAIVGAFMEARKFGRPPPLDSVEIDDPAPEYFYETPILRPRSSIQTNDRTVSLVARAERPLLAVLNNVLSGDEAEELIELARPRLKPSTLVDPQTGQNIVTELRSSFGMFFRLQENALIARLDRRISEVMNLPIENGEGFQILYYPTGAQSTPHFDFLIPSNSVNQDSLTRSGQRVSTMVTYLNEVECGGETIFPQVGWSVTPKRGNAVYFEYSNSLNQVDHATLHASSPILRGEKWVATKWMRQRRFISA